MSHIQSHRVEKSEQIIINPIDTLVIIWPQFSVWFAIWISLSSKICSRFFRFFFFSFGKSLSCISGFFFNYIIETPNRSTLLFDERKSTFCFVDISCNHTRANLQCFLAIANTTAKGFNPIELNEKKRNKLNLNERINVGLTGLTCGAGVSAINRMKWRETKWKHTLIAFVMSI